MNWISQKEAAEILGISAVRIKQLRSGYVDKQNGKDYFNEPKFPETVWRYTTKIEYDKDFILKFKAEKDGKNI